MSLYEIFIFTAWSCCIWGGGFYSGRTSKEREIAAEEIVKSLKGAGSESKRKS